MRSFHWFKLALAALLLAGPLAAARAGAGDLAGSVKDSLGAAVPGAQVVAVDEATGAEFRATTDGSGGWTIAHVPAGSYTVTVTATATAPTVLAKTVVATEGTARADAVLKVGLAETVTVTASKTEELLVDAPAQVTILGERRIQAQPTQNFADIMREVPGVNVVQMSSRDFNVTPRASASVPAASQLVMIDGRPINQDYYGYVAWDFLPTNLADARQIEVLRGAASSVWGDYAVNGVVNIITKSPRESSTFVTLGGGTFDRSGGIAESDSGSLYYVNAGVARPLSERWAVKLNGGYSDTDAFARPSGTIDNKYQTPYPPFTNYGTKQPKVDARADYDSLDGRHHLSLSGGYAGTGGTFHTGLGPFHLDQGAHGAYGMIDYRVGGWSVKTFANFWGGDASSLLAVGPLGAPLLLEFSDKSWDIEAQKSQVVARRHSLTYGGSYRHTWTNVTMAPGAEKRDVFGAYLQDDILISSHFSAVLGARVDKYDVLKDPVFSPRVALMFKPTPAQVFRLSYSRAYRAPSLFQNYLDTTVVNRMNLGLLNPALDGRFYYFPVNGLGNVDLSEQTLDAYEAGYTASLFKGKAHAGVSFYLTDSRGDMILTQTGSYTSANPPPGWPLPPFVLDALVAANAFGPGLGLPSILSFQNLGEVRNKGVELSVDAQPVRYFSVFANYSYQAEPDPDFSISKINLPPKDRFNAGVNFDYKLLTASVSVAYTDKAYFRDVLDATYAAWTKPWTVINASAGLRLPGDHGLVSVKVRNLGNDPVQNHPFGDLLRRQIVGELTLRP